MKDLEDEARIKRELAEQASLFQSEQDRVKARVAGRERQSEQAQQALASQHNLEVAAKQLAQVRKLADKGVFTRFLPFGNWENGSKLVTSYPFAAISYWNRNTCILAKG